MTTISPLNASQTNHSICERLYQHLIKNPVQWLKQPGPHETIRKTIAVFAAILLSLTIVGIPLVILAYKEWSTSRTSDADIYNHPVMRNHLQQILERLPSRINSNEFRNNLTDLENFINTRNQFLQNLNPSDYISLPSLEQMLNVLRNGILARQTLINNVHSHIVAIETDLSMLSRCADFVENVRAVQQQVDEKNSQYHRFEEQAQSQRDLENRLMQQLEDRQRELINSARDRANNAISQAQQQILRGQLNDLENMRIRAELRNQLQTKANGVFSIERECGQAIFDTILSAMNEASTPSQYEEITRRCEGRLQRLRTVSNEIVSAIYRCSNANEAEQRLREGEVRIRQI